jgi:hypothetical protein
MSRFTNLTLTELEADQSAIECALEAKRRQAAAMETLLEIDGELYPDDSLIAFAKARANVLNASSAWGSEDGALINALVARIEGVSDGSIVALLEDAFEIICDQLPGEFPAWVSDARAALFAMRGRP